MLPSSSVPHQFVRSLALEAARLLRRDGLGMVIGGVWGRRDVVGASRMRAIGRFSIKKLDF